MAIEPGNMPTGYDPIGLALRDYAKTLSDSQRQLLQGREISDVVGAVVQSVFLDEGVLKVRYDVWGDREAAISGLLQHCRTVTSGDTTPGEDPHTHCITLADNSKLEITIR